MNPHKLTETIQKKKKPCNITQVMQKLLLLFLACFEGLLDDQNACDTVSLTSK
jgi:hypothetical protein